VRLFAVPFEPFLLPNLGMRFLLGGEGCDTPIITVADTLFYNASVVQPIVYLGLSSLSKLNLSFEYYKAKSHLPLVREPPNFSYRCVNINSHYGRSS
jgi:hypothetical protein